MGNRIINWNRLNTTEKQGILDDTELNASGSPTLNLNYGGLAGAMPRYGYVDSKGTYYAEWINATPYVRQNLIPVMLTYPKALDLIPDRDRWIGIFKAAMEVEAQSISGLNTTRTLEVDDSTKITGGQVFAAPTGVTIASTSISYTWKERMGRPFGKWLDFWLEYLISDPYTKRALVTRYLEQKDSNKEFTLYTPDLYTVTMLFIEPSNQMTTVEQAWLAFNMMPKSGGNREGKREVDALGETIDLSVDFTSIVMDTDAVKKLAKSILPRLVSLYEVPDLDLTLPVAGFDASVKDNKTAHSSDTPQGNVGDLRWDTHPTGR